MVWRNHLSTQFRKVIPSRVFQQLACEYSWVYQHKTPQFPLLRQFSPFLKYDPSLGAKTVQKWTSGFAIFSSAPMLAIFSSLFSILAAEKALCVILHPASDFSLKSKYNVLFIIIKSFTGTEIKKGKKYIKIKKRRENKCRKAKPLENVKQAKV